MVERQEEYRQEGKSGTREPTVGIKFDHDKPRWDLLDYDFVEDVVKVLTFGAKKYAPDNWKYVEEYRYKAALGRHIAAYMNGEFCDEETGISHLAHAACCLMFLNYFQRKQRGMTYDAQ